MLLSAEYGLSNLNINYEGHSNITIDGGNQVLFSVTGLSSKPFDISNILAMYDVAIENGHITGLNTGELNDNSLYDIYGWEKTCAGFVQKAFQKI